MVRTTTLMTACTMLIGVSSAHAYVNTMYNVGFDPATVGSQIASLDSTLYDYNDPSNLDPGRLDSGFTADVLDGTGNPIVTTNRTSLMTEVFEVSTATTLTDVSGNLNLSPGDLIFSYTLDLVDASPNAVETLSNFNIFASTFVDPVNTDIFTADIVLGRGFGTAGLANGTTAEPMAQVADFESISNDPISFSALDWAFPALQADQMPNGTSIRFLMFTRPANIEVGLSGFSGEPGQAPATTDGTANGVPILVPIVPAPGAMTLAGLAGVALLRNRRKS